MNRHKKNLTLISGLENGFSWNIKFVIYDDEIIKNTSEIKVRDNKEDYLRYKETYKNYTKNHKEGNTERVQLWREQNEERNRKNQRLWARKHPKEIQNYMKKYLQTDKGIAYNRRRGARHRGLGTREINFYVIGTVGHHVNDEEILYIPEEVHRSFQTGEQERHRELIKEWLREIRPDLYLRAYA